jgi:hypothetical protein
MSQSTEPIWPILADSIVFNSDAYLEHNNLTAEEKEEAH